MGRLGRTLAAGCLFLAAAASAQAQPTCSLTQLTNTTGGTNLFDLGLSINATGTRIAFASNADLLGSNGDGSPEIFLWDAATGFTQITNLNSSLTSNPRVNAAGNRIAFSSNANPLGGNGDGNADLFLWDASSGLTQITNTVGGNNFFSTIDATGNQVTFHSSTNPLGSNGDLNPEIFLWDAATGLLQITNTVGGVSLFPVISASGNRIAFHSGDGNLEIFLWDASTGLTQITHTPDEEHFPTINASGNRIAFSSTANLTGGNIDGNRELFLWDSSTGFTQLTNTTYPHNTFLPAINAAGNRIAIESNADILGNGSGSYEIFLWDASSGFTQITNSDQNSLYVAIDAEGSRIVFTSSANFLGSNSDGNYEIFLASCRGALTEVAVPAVSPLGLAALAVLLGLAAAWTLRRRREPV